MEPNRDTTPHLTEPAAPLMTNVVIRRYEPRDRATIRDIACDTVDRGEPVEQLFVDRELVADLLTQYYTDYEPQAAWVAEHQGRGIGYLTGCLDSRRYVRVIEWRVAPSAVLRSIGRGSLASPMTWRCVAAAAKTWLRGGFRRGVPLDRYPAHLHVNLRQGFRGRRVGRQLVERFMQQAQQAGAPGIHVSVRGDNAAACRLFEGLGFAQLSRHPVVFPLGVADQLRETTVYGKSL